MALDYGILDDMSGHLGDAFYLLDSGKFSGNFDAFLSAFTSIYPKTNIGYSYKTNYTPKLCKIVNEKGGYAEVVSEMEYDLAIKIGVDPEMIIINGPYKNKRVLEKFLLGKSIVNLDSYTEVESLKKIVENHPNKQFQVGIRCNFEINDVSISRFGFDVESDNFKHMFVEINSIENIAINGIHCHFPNRDLESYEYRVDKILALTQMLFFTPPKYIDIGGGFFGKMNDSLKAQFNTPVVAYQEYANIIATKFKEHYQDYNNAEKPMLLLEPGSAIVADTMYFVSKVIDIKEVRGRVLATSSGSKFNMGLLTSTINMPMTVYSKNVVQKLYKAIDIVGFTCIESDCLYKGYYGRIGVGDYLVFSNIGSYSIVFKPPFIMPNGPVIEYSETMGNYEIIKRKETVDDVFATFVI
ncbi:MAG: Diaminopimelate decarboxylase [Catillopecten margaritatus gill symbiont]|uniref:Diaminopimelate decarboxylase n=1 Tax=Catillopecten margaritatus gill symbiont TaxID=3083288 RepID=A0AAU6PFY6_9GAMM